MPFICSVMSLCFGMEGAIAPCAGGIRMWRVRVRSVRWCGNWMDGCAVDSGTLGDAISCTGANLFALGVVVARIADFALTLGTICAMRKDIVDKATDIC